MPDIVAWQAIADRYSDTLLLGNGASISLDACFSYPSLLDKAKTDGAITPDVDAIFEYFRTTDFEQVMRMLWHAFNVNAALGIGETRTQQAYIDLRAALIQTVRGSHVGFGDIRRHLLPIQDFMGRFQKVLSLNYDLTTYWAMLEGNEIRGGNWFKDCWLEGAFEGDWEYLKTPYGVAGTTLVFFPHGNLLFATHPTTGEVKLSVGDNPSSLLDRIIQAWTDENALPMFVSEGESRQKESAIARHSYLSTIYNDVMTDIGPSVAVYGWGMGENDEHILKRVAGRQAERIAVSVLRAGRSEEQLEVHCAEVALKIARHNPRVNVEFYDAESCGCWRHP
jgi:hypothetical protein